MIFLGNKINTKWKANWKNLFLLHPSANHEKKRVMREHANNSTRKGMKEYSDRLQYSDRFKHVILFFKMTSSQTRCTTRILVRNWWALAANKECCEQYNVSIVLVNHFLSIKNFILGIELFFILSSSTKFVIHKLKCLFQKFPYKIFKGKICSYNMSE